MDKKTLLEALEALESIKGIGDIQPPPENILGAFFGEDDTQEIDFYFDELGNYIKTDPYEVTVQEWQEAVEHRPDSVFANCVIIIGPPPDVVGP